MSVDASRINSDVSGMLIPVISVRNPDLIAVQIHVSLEIRTADGVRTTRLGSFSLFPADNPGTFTVPFARARLLAAAAGQPAPETCVLVFRLEPIVADEALREVRLEIGALRWIS